MKLTTKNLVPVMAAVALAALGWAVLFAAGASAPTDLAPPTEEVKRGGPPSSCCDPELEPGVGGNPFCFEGHTCCSSGNWQCNNADATPSCEAGEVCADGCGDRNDACSSGDDCCSGICKPNGRCK